jgi:hypothetical protein
MKWLGFAAIGVCLASTIALALDRNDPSYFREVAGILEERGNFVHCKDGKHHLRFEFSEDNSFAIHDTGGIGARNYELESVWGSSHGSFADDGKIISLIEDHPRPMLVFMAEIVGDRQLKRIELYRATTDGAESRKTPLIDCEVL